MTEQKEYKSKNEELKIKLLTEIKEVEENLKNLNINLANLKNKGGLNP